MSDNFYIYIGIWTVAIICVVFLGIITLGLLIFNRYLSNKVFASLGGWKSMMELRQWNRSKGAYFVDGRQEWVEKARVIVRGHTMEPESHYTEIAIQSLCNALSSGELNMPTSDPEAP